MCPVGGSPSRVRTDEIVFDKGPHRVLRPGPLHPKSVQCLPHFTLLPPDCSFHYLAVFIPRSLLRTYTIVLLTPKAKPKKGLVYKIKIPALYGTGICAQKTRYLEPVTRFHAAIKSAGTGASNFNFLPVSGCLNSIRRACSMSRSAVAPR